MQVGGGEGAATIDYRSQRASGGATFAGRYQPHGRGGRRGARARSSSSWPSATCCIRATGRALRTARVSPRRRIRCSRPPPTASRRPLTDAARLPAAAFAAPPPLVHYAREVDVAIFGPPAPLALTIQPPSDR